MENKHILKNDQNNHLIDQIGEFVQCALNKSEAPVLVSHFNEALCSDEVTTIYVRGYN
ncbi:hypothetical protein [uncultured Shewanella sp.]|uniref:hypothetical protein n=1 Tax=Shewanella atlantica TaxID=271099 RepID=UPI0026104A04|nr:hypothetical protein [uncultured Shewanella sp.]